MKKITEKLNSKSIDIDKKEIIDILSIFNEEDTLVVKAVKDCIKDIEKIIDMVT